MSKLLSKSALLEGAAPKISSILSSHKSPHHFPILSRSQLSRVASRRPPITTRKDRRKAAILLPILDLSSSDGRTSNPSILFTLRSPTLNSHADEICFPGGHYDPLLDGNSLARTALRETREELSPSPSSDHHHHHRYDWNDGVQILGRTSSVPSVTGVPVTPFLACLPHTFPDREALHECFPGNPREVSRVFCVGVEELLEGEGSTPPSERWGGKEGPVFETEHGRIWGLTATVLRPILHGVLRPAFGGGG